MFRNDITRSAISLGLLTIICTSAVVYTFITNEEKIVQSEKQYLLKKLHELIKPEEYDNDIYTDTILIEDKQYLNTTQHIKVYRARKGGKSIAAIFTTTALDGYNGKIKILVGIYQDGSLAGARIISHRETPGLGDAIDEDKSNWIDSFDGKSLDQTTDRNWRVKKDGGIFDQFTGATITPRAVIQAIKNALHYFNNNNEKLFMKL